MFILTDCTKSFPNDIVCNDVKDLRNIVLGITDDDTIADAAYNAVCNMTFGDSYMVNPLFAIDCVRDHEVTGKLEENQRRRDQRKETHT